MRIAVLGWGSLIWDPRNLMIENNCWYPEGPRLPIEFARISVDQRLTLVIKSGVQDVQVLFSISKYDKLNEAIQNLVDREGTSEQAVGYYNYLTTENRVRPANRSIIPSLINWRTKNQVDAVIWTDLAPKFRDVLNVNYDLAGIRNYLGSLDKDALARAREYVFNAPPQIQTTFRQSILQLLDNLMME